MLARVVICGNCGGIMVRNTIKKTKGVVYTYFVCPSSKKRGNGVCTTHIANESVIVEIVVEAIRKQIAIALDIECAIKKLENHKLLKREKNFYSEQLKTLNYNKSRINILKNGLYEDLKSGLLSKKEYLFSKANYQKKVETIEQQIRHLCSEVDERNSIYRNDFDIFIRIKKIGDLKTLTRELVVELIDSIYINDDKSVNINFKFDDELKKLKYIIAS